LKIETEDKAIILLCSLPSSYEHVVTTLTYGKESIKVEDITAALLARELRIKNDAVDDPLGDALLVRGEHSKEKVKERRRRKCGAMIAVS
jgi:cell division cycle protein 20 (cofactor of APC complex)